MWYLFESYKTTAVQPTFVGTSKIIEAGTRTDADNYGGGRTESGVTQELHQTLITGSNSFRGNGWDGTYSTSQSSSFLQKRSINSLVETNEIDGSVRYVTRTQFTAQPIIVRPATTTTDTKFIRVATTTLGNVRVNTITTDFGTDGKIYFANRTTNVQSTIIAIQSSTITITVQSRYSQTLTTGNEGTRIVSAVADSTWIFIPQRREAFDLIRRPRNDVIIVPHNSEATTTTKYPASSFNLTSLTSYSASWTPPLSKTLTNTTTGFVSEFDSDINQFYNKTETFATAYENDNNTGANGQTRESVGPSSTTWTGSSATQTSSTSVFVQPITRKDKRTSVFLVGPNTSSDTYAIGDADTTTTNTIVNVYENSYSSSSKTFILPGALRESPLNPTTWQGPEGQNANIFAWPPTEINPAGLTVIYSAITTISDPTTKTQYTSSFIIAPNLSWTSQDGATYTESAQFKVGDLPDTSIRQNNYTAGNRGTHSRQTIVNGEFFSTFKNSAGDGFGDAGRARLESHNLPLFIYGDNRGFFRAANPNLSFNDNSTTFAQSFAAIVKIEGAEHSVGDMYYEAFNGGNDNGVFYCPPNHWVARPIASFTTVFSRNSNFGLIPDSLLSTFTIIRKGSKISSTWNYRINSSITSNSGVCSVVTARSFSHGATYSPTSSFVFGGRNFPHQSITIGIATDTATIYVRRDKVMGTTTLSAGFQMTTVASENFIEWWVCPEVYGEGLGAVSNLVDEGLP